MVDCVKIDTFAELFEAVENFQADSEVSWYRGCRRSSYPLLPSIMRRNPALSFDAIKQLEDQITARFVQRSMPFINRPFLNEWDKLFFMQHYGVPTRLLDWTENPFVAIYFAITPGEIEPDEDACVWLCDPHKWNGQVMSGYAGNKGVQDQSARYLGQYSPDAPLTDIPKDPIMMYGSYNSPRIVAQRGGFALYGHCVEPMEVIHAKGGFPEGALRKLEIKAASISEIRASLLRKGFTESVVFPDLDGLAKELKREFGFSK